MVAEQRIDEEEPVPREAPIVYIIYELLPLFAEACREGGTARWRRQLLLAEVDRLCATHGPL